MKDSPHSALPRCQRDICSTGDFNDGFNFSSNFLEVLGMVSMVFSSLDFTVLSLSLLTMVVVLTIAF